MIRKFILLCGVLFCSALFADEGNECCAKIDIGPAYARVDELLSGVTQKTYNLGGIKADGTFQVYKPLGLVIKPSILAVGGDARLFAGSLGLGVCIPLCERKVFITPYFGATYTYFHGKTNVDIPLPDFSALHLHPKEKFHSIGPFVAIDATWTFIKDWRLGLQYQYSWSTVRTTIDFKEPFNLFNLCQRSHTQGSSIGGYIEHDLNAHWSINLGAAYNVSLTKEKHGLRGAGVKLGLAYWF
jgi:hypothetical protein